MIVLVTVLVLLAMLGGVWISPFLWILLIAARGAFQLSGARARV